MRPQQHAPLMLQACFKQKNHSLCTCVPNSLLIKALKMLKTNKQTKIKLTLCVSVLLHVPDGVELIVVFIADDFVLVESPFGENFSGKFQSVTRVDMNQLDLRSD
jgi:hypothetical protein